MWKEVFKMRFWIDFLKIYCLIRLEKYELLVVLN